MVEDVKPISHIDADYILRVLECIEVYEDGTLVLVFLEGTESELNKKKGMKNILVTPEGIINEYNASKPLSYKWLAGIIHTFVNTPDAVGNNNPGGVCI